MTFFSRVPGKLIRQTKGYAALWLVALILWRVGDWLPLWLLAIAFVPSLPLGIAWLRQLRLNRDCDPMTRSLVLTVLYPFWWQLSVFLCEFVGWHELRAGLTTLGTWGLFFII